MSCRTLPPRESLSLLSRDSIIREATVLCRDDSFAIGTMPPAASAIKAEIEQRTAVRGWQCGGASAVSNTAVCQGGRGQACGPRESLAWPLG